MSIIIDKYIVSLLKLVCSCYTWMVLSFLVIMPSDYVQAQDPDEEGGLTLVFKDDRLLKIKVVDGKLVSESIPE